MNEAGTDCLLLIIIIVIVIYLHVRFTVKHFVNNVTKSFTVAQNEKIMQENDEEHKKSPN